MALPSEQPKPRLTEAEVVGWFEGEIARGLDTAEAFGEMLKKRIYPQRLERELIEIIGVQGIRVLWNMRVQRFRRPGAPVVESEEDTTDELADESPATPADISTHRVHNLRPLTDPKSMLEARYKMGDRWVRLGDMTSQDCRAVANYYGKQTSYFSQRELFFDKLADGLKADPNAKVQDKYDNRKLRQLFEDCRTER